MTRLLVTHAGSLPRPFPLIDALAGKAPDADLDELVEEAVAEAVANQSRVGVDIASDGEQGRESFFTYIQHRMSGFGVGDGTRRGFQDMNDFPGFLDLLRSQRSDRSQVSLTRPPQAIGPVSYGDRTDLRSELERFERASADAGFVDRFVTAPSPGIVVAAMANRYYSSDDEYLAAVAEALGVEYRAVNDAGHLLQIDAPDLAMERHGAFRDRPLGDFLGFVDSVVAAINQATEGLDPSRIRLHVCWGNYEGPHTHDVDLADLLDSLYQARVGGLLLSGGNPRHEHEYREFARSPLPEGWTLAAGVIDTTTNYVEHPEVVADRLVRTAEVIGDPGRIVAATDCGFDTAAGFGVVAADVAWAKVASLRAGADLASERLFA